MLYQGKYLRMARLLSVVSGILFSMNGLAGEPVAKPGIHTAFDPKTAEWKIGWPGRVSQYDLAYLSPPVDPMQGIPLGNGEIGVLFWCEDSKLIAVVNKSDLWDDAAFGPFHNWSGKEEDLSTTQRHACRIIVDFKLPVFNILYLSDFRAKLNLADASMTMEATSPFGKIRVRAFVDHRTGLLLYDLNSNLNEDVPLEVAVERYGSRTYSHWYSQINRNSSIGLSGTGTIAGDDGVFITQKLSSGTFAAGGKVMKDNNLSVKYLREHSRCGVFRLTGNPQKTAQLAFSVTSPLETDPVAVVMNSLDEAKKSGWQSYELSNAEAWKAIWNRSMMDYGDDYLNNLWHLTMFYANASQGGKYPGRFNNGLWGWSRDVQNWNFYFHWNQQQLFWPLNAAGHHDLESSYLDFRFRSLPQAKKDAQELFKSDGAFISDVTERRGFNSSGEKINHTPIAEIALDFWRHFQFTGDKMFLREKALPFIVEAARFYKSILGKEEDGLYHAKEGSGYEGWIKLRDGLTELVYARALFSTALEALKTAGTTLPEASGWKDILDHLAPLLSVQAGEDAITREGSGYRLTTGFYKGKPCPSDRIFAAGWGIKENRMLMVYSPVKDTAINNGMKLLDGIFPSVPSSPVFPSGTIGLAQKGSELFDKMTATALLYGPEITGWDPVPVVMARLGLGAELSADLQRFPSRWQIYCNGWGHWGLEGEVNKDAGWFFRTNQVRDVNSPDKEERFPLPMWPFRHMSMESMSVLATAMNESLLQSHDGVLRVFPAFPAEKDCRFTLHARGGFIVSSEIRSGKVQWICLESLLGSPCTVEIPWDQAVVQNAGAKKGKIFTGRRLELKTKVRDRIMLLPSGSGLSSWSVMSEMPAANEKAKIHGSGNARLGLERMF